LTWRTAAVVGGLAVASVSVFLDWVTVGNFGGGPMDDNARFRVGDWLDMDMVDGYLVLALGVLGVALAVLHVRRTLPAALRPYGTWLAPGVGGVIAVLAGLNMEYVSSNAGVDIGLGLYLCLAGGAAAAASPWVPDRRITRRTRAGAGG
jgi:hypothetical protein